MFDALCGFVTSHNDVSKVVREAEKFSVTLPLLGKVGVPPPKHIAFYSVLGVLGVTELIPWPVALGIGVGHALTVRGSANETPTSEIPDEPQDEASRPEAAAAPTE